MNITTLEVPSGATYSLRDLLLLELMASYGFIRWSDEPFKLNSGVMSHVYIFGREDMTEHPDLLAAMGWKIRTTVHELSIEEKRIPCLIGIPESGNVFAQAAVMNNYYQDPVATKPIIFHVMRAKQKKHGAHGGWVNGKPKVKEHFYITVDNVVTNGASKVETARRLLEDAYPGFEIPQIIVVDREQGGISLMKKAGFTTIVPLYRLLDMTYTFKELGLWPAERVSAVEKEIKEHQFKIS